MKHSEALRNAETVSETKPQWRDKAAGEADKRVLAAIQGDDSQAVVKTAHRRPFATTSEWLAYHTRSWTEIVQKSIAWHIANPAKDGMRNLRIQKVSLWLMSWLTRTHRDIGAGTFMATAHQIAGFNGGTDAEDIRFCLADFLGKCRDGKFPGGMIYRMDSVNLAKHRSMYGDDVPFVGYLGDEHA